jgi:hypothetical protein
VVLTPKSAIGRHKRRRKKRENDSEAAGDIVEKIVVPKSNKMNKKPQELIDEGIRQEEAPRPKAGRAAPENLPAFSAAPDPPTPEKSKPASSELTVYSLSTSLLGKFSMEKGSTLADLRKRIETVAESNGRNRPTFSFYDLQAKQRIGNEGQQKVSKLPAVVVVDKESSLSAILAQSTIMGDKSIRPGKNSMSFQVRLPLPTDTGPLKSSTDFQHSFS